MKTTMGNPPYAALYTMLFLVGIYTDIKPGKIPELHQPLGPGAVLPGLDGCPTGRAAEGGSTIPVGPWLDDFKMN